jgi:putative addiction module component (TIGR02574 family)
MELSPDLIHQVFALAPQDRYELAHHLLDSIDDDATADLDEAFVSELRRRRDDMLRGDEVVADWRASLTAIENDLPRENRR